MSQHGMEKEWNGRETVQEMEIAVQRTGWIVYIYGFVHVYVCVD